MKGEKAEANGKEQKLYLYVWEKVLTQRFPYSPHCIFVHSVLTLFISARQTERESSYCKQVRQYLPPPEEKYIVNLCLHSGFGRSPHPEQSREHVPLCVWGQTLIRPHLACRGRQRVWEQLSESNEGIEGNGSERQMNPIYGSRSVPYTLRTALRATMPDLHVPHQVFIYGYHWQ